MGRKVPQDYLDKILARVLDAASKPDVPKKNRDMLYETADELEKKNKGDDDSSRKGKRAKKAKGDEKKAHLAPLIAAMPAKPSASRRRRRKAAAAAKGTKKKSGLVASTPAAKVKKTKLKAKKGSAGASDRDVPKAMKKKAKKAT